MYCFLVTDSTRQSLQRRWWQSGQYSVNTDIPACSPQLLHDHTHSRMIQEARSELSLLGFLLLCFCKMPSGLSLGILLAMISSASILAPGSSKTFFTSATRAWLITPKYELYGAATNLFLFWSGKDGKCPAAEEGEEVNTSHAVWPCWDYGESPQTERCDTQANQWRATGAVVEWTLAVPGILWKTWVRVSCEWAARSAMSGTRKRGPLLCEGNIG